MVQLADLLTLKPASHMSTSSTPMSSIPTQLLANGLGKQQKMAQVLESLLPMWKIWLKLLVLAWFSKLFYHQELAIY